MVTTPTGCCASMPVAGARCRNAVARPQVTIVFPPAPHADGMSLVVDGDATVAGDHVDVVPTWAVLHRPAPPVA